MDEVSLEAIRDSAFRWWQNSGSCPTIPPEPTGATQPILTEVRQLQDYLLAQGWQLAGSSTWVKWFVLEDGTSFALTLEALSRQASSTFGAKASPGGQPIPTSSSQNPPSSTPKTSGGGASRAQPRASRKSTEDATRK